MKKLAGFLLVACFTHASFSAPVNIPGPQNFEGDVYLKGVKLTATAADLNGGLGAKSTTAVTNVVLTTRPAAITATAAVTPQTVSITNVYPAGTTNVYAVCTNASVAVTVVNGGVVLTNATISISQ